MKTRTVLLVLEDQHDLNTYGTFLRNRGYEILIYTSPSAGINALGTESVSIVVVGQDTPTFEGRQVLEYSLRLHPEVPVVVVARVLNIHSYLEAMELGACDYLEWPELEDLAWTIDTQLPRDAVA